MKKILLVTDVPFWMRQKGNHQRIAEMVSYLSDHFRMTIVFLGIETPRLHEDHPNIVHICRHRGLSALAWKLFRSMPGRMQHAIVKLLQGLNLRRSLDSFGNDRVIDQFKSIYRDGSFDAVIIEYIWHGYLAEAVDRERSLLLLDTHDIFHRRINDYARFGRTPDKIVTREQELAVYRQFDRLIAIQKVEFDYLDSLFPGRVILAMHPAKTHADVYLERMRDSGIDDKLTLVYFASYGDANLDGIEWFIEEVWNPELAEKFELQVHGAICDSLNSTEAGVRICGRSPTIDAVYRGADIALNPQRFGSGLKIKTVEAMSYGIPVLTTSAGAEGLEEAVDLAVLLADDANRMRQNLHRLADITLRETLSRNGLEFVAHRLTPEACFGPLRQFIEAYHRTNVRGESSDE